MDSLNIAITQLKIDLVNWILNFKNVPRISHRKLKVMKINNIKRYRDNKERCKKANFQKESKDKFIEERIRMNSFSYRKIFRIYGK